MPVFLITHSRMALKLEQWMAWKKNEREGDFRREVIETKTSQNIREGALTPKDEGTLGRWASHLVKEHH
jgi:hypothetical protein